MNSLRQEKSFLQPTNFASTKFSLFSWIFRCKDLIDVGSGTVTFIHPRPNMLKIEK